MAMITFFQSTGKTLLFVDNKNVKNRGKDNRDWYTHKLTEMKDNVVTVGHS